MTFQELYDKQAGAAQAILDKMNTTSNIDVHQHLTDAYASALKALQSIKKGGEVAGEPIRQN